MTDNELLELLEKVQAEHRSIMEQRATLQASNVKIFGCNGQTLDDIIKREFDVEQNLEKLLTELRNRSSQSPTSSQ